MSQHIGSISEFLIHAGTQYAIFDMGRCIRSLEPQTFLAIEQGELPAPYPRQRHAWFGIVYWNKPLSEHRYIWFLKLPLDERGCVLDAARQQFLEIIVSAISKNKQTSAPATDSIDLNEAQQPDNPYIFTPAQQQLADFNALSRKTLQLPPSADHVAAHDYLLAPAAQDWRNISVQGISDAVHFSTESDLLQFSECIEERFPPEVQVPLMSALENRVPCEKVAQVLDAQYHQSLAQKKPSALQFLRAMAMVPDDDLRKNTVLAALDTFGSHPDPLLVIAGRHWQALKSDDVMTRFLEAAAYVDEDRIQYPFFCGLFADIVQIPATRHAALNAVRSADRSDMLSQAIGALFNQRGE
ncbi:DUF3549 family protein [Alteromonas oceanisediminis]|uniref:DUF3549 family protein n=1 Tax=Alteromonas oceanisediminis TaxID=2836180 RepID=UPI001BD980B0|nr:DUF3549 family protein [Alteromonas oceanisediminis]MBT0585020.1 DUF3549 family protein [Alteromonas oceanisediminis]